LEVAAVTAPRERGAFRRCVEAEFAIGDDVDPRLRGDIPSRKTHDIAAAIVGKPPIAVPVREVVTGNLHLCRRCDFRLDRGTPAADRFRVLALGFRDGFRALDLVEGGAVARMKYDPRGGNQG